MAENYFNSKNLSYPLTKMNFLVTVDGIDGTAAFSEVTGMEASVDVIEFRQGNAHSLAPVKLPGLVKHGNVTLKYGYTYDNAFKQWVMDCVSDTRKEPPRHSVMIELIDINGGSPEQMAEAVTSETYWVLSDAWVTKYSAPDMDAKTSDVAYETVEIAYEELTIPN